jgi:methylated-DNA-[protein]-cysteine S-methyltransferase
MTRLPAPCREIEADLVAAATREADIATGRRVRDHLDGCEPCRLAFRRYEEIEQAVGGLAAVTPADVRLAPARSALEARLVDLRTRLVAYRVFSSPVGPLLIGRSERGVSLVEYLGRRHGIAGSRLSRAAGVEAVPGGPEIDALYRELIEYLGGRRNQLGWALDLRLARTDFHRAVLQATAAVPYGAVTSYSRIAREIGHPTAARAVAQALRWNPLPIVVPCHRVVGASGRLVGYAGNRVGLKRELLGVEGVPTVKAPHDLRVERAAMYVLYPDSDEYCVPTCPSITPEGLGTATLFSSRVGVEATGVRPCGTCRPDLHPLAR